MPSDVARPSDPGQRRAERVKTHGAQAERPGVEVLEAEGPAGPRPGVLPGLQPDPLAEPVRRGLTGQAEAAAQLGAELPFVPAGVGAQELPGELGVPALA